MNRSVSRSTSVTRLASALRSQATAPHRSSACFPASTTTRFTNSISATGSGKIGSFRAMLRFWPDPPGPPAFAASEFYPRVVQGHHVVEAIRTTAPGQCVNDPPGLVQRIVRPGRVEWLAILAKREAHRTGVRVNITKDHPADQVIRMRPEAQVCRIRFRLFDQLSCARRINACQGFVLRDLLQHGLILVLWDHCNQGVLDAQTKDIQQEHNHRDLASGKLPAKHYTAHACLEKLLGHQTLVDRRVD